MPHLSRVFIKAFCRWSLVGMVLCGCGGQVPEPVDLDCSPAAPATAAWTPVAASSSWFARDSHVLFTANAKLFLYGGWEDSYLPSPRDLWESTDGKAWTQISETAAAPASDYAPVASAFGRQWMITGWKDGRLETQGGSNEIWAAADGAHWSKVGDAPFSGRVGASLVAFKGRLWLFGGTENYFAENDAPFKNDVWSSPDGITWTKVAENAPWSARAFANAAVLGDKLFLAGGGRYGDGESSAEFSAKGDVWSTTDGVEWINETTNAGWTPRIWSSMVAYRGGLWFMGGWSNSPATNHQDVWWSADGKQWQKQPDALWTPRHAFSTVVFNDQVILAGGNHDRMLQSDVWSLSTGGAAKPECGPGF